MPSQPPAPLRAGSLLLALAALAQPVCAAAEEAPSPPATPQNAPPANAAPLQPQPAGADGLVVYTPDFFTTFAPRSALDMVRRVPGFAVDNGDDRRGFSGAGGNVLIDGERPSAKSQSAGDILARIPAGQVDRIELSRGAQNSEAAGQFQVVNVIRRRDAAEAGGGLYELDLEHSNGSGRVTARGSLSYTGRIGAAEYTVGVNRYMQERPLSGVRLLSDAAGAPTGTRQDYTPRTFREARSNGSLSAPLFDGTLNINAEAGRENFRTTLDSAGFAATGALTDSFDLGLNYRTRDREIGGDWERTVNGVTLKLLGLDRRSWQADDDASTARDALGAITAIDAQRVRNRAQESIARATISFAPFDGLTLETGLEAAFNALDAGLELTRDTGAGPVRVALPNANVRIEEDRAEGFARAVLSLGAGATVEASAAFETSTISQSGDAAVSRTLDYWKPSVQFSQTFGAGNQWRVRLLRDVGQLDFDDFASSVDLNDARVIGGNPSLEPDTRWRLEGGVDWRWGETGALSVSVYHDWISDLVDRAPIVTLGGVFDARANIGDAEVTRASAKLTLPIDAVLPGGRIEGEIGYGRSEVIDPVTLKTRPLSGFADVSFDVELRQDAPALSLAWGLEYEGQSEFELFRLNEREIYVEGPFLSGFIETNALPAKVRVYAWNLTDATFRRERRFFAPTRADAPSRQELRKRTFGSFIGIEVSGKF